VVLLHQRNINLSALWRCRLSASKGIGLQEDSDPKDHLEDLLDT